MEAGKVTDVMNPFLGKQLTQGELRMYNPIKLAYIGDAVYELYIRSYVLSKFNLKIKDINKKCISYVKATAQSKIVNHVMPILEEEELGIIKKGRNAPVNTIPKNSSVIDYKMATGFEALLGYLHLGGNIERLEEIIAKGIRFIEES